MNGRKYVGTWVPRPDGEDKVKGRYDYLADRLPVSGALCGAVLFSKKAHAFIKSLDLSQALAVPGVTVLTYEDAPKIKYNSGQWFPGQDDHPDEQILTGHVRHVGDRIALVLAPDFKTARYARSLIKVAYEEKPAPITFEEAEALAESFHEDGVKNFPGRLTYGQVDQGFAGAAYTFKSQTRTPKIHPAALEPHAVVAIPQSEGVVEIHTPCQIMFGVQQTVANVLNMPLSKVKVVKVRMGGTFGGKQESVFEPLCAWAALKLRRPVFINTTREESLLATRTRTATFGEVETALDAEGKILARRFTVTADAGAYLSGAKKVLMAMGKKTSRLYRVPALDYQGRVLRTATTPSGACRGYGSPQIHALTEIHTDALCRKFNFDPVDFRLKNLMKAYEEDPSGAANIGNAQIIACLEQGLKAFNWDARKTPTSEGRFRRGAGLAVATHGNGYYKTVYHDVAGMSLRLLEDGSAVLRSGVHELGNAALAAMIQIAAEETTLPPEKIHALEGDTLHNPYDIGCQASRGIYVMGEAARRCGAEAAALLTSKAALLWKGPIKIKDGQVHTGEGVFPMGEAVRQLEMKHSCPIEVFVSHQPEANPASYGAHFAEVLVDTLTGMCRVEKYLAVHDIGQAINPQAVKGQIYGGVQMGLGMALSEEMEYDRQGNPKARNFDKYHLINAPDMPEVEVILIEKGEPGGPFGAKSIGEIATVPVAPAVVNAVNRALGLELNHLPLTPARIVAGLLAINGQA